MMAADLDFPIRINIHLSVADPLLTAVNELNAEILKRWGSEVVFRENGGDAIPHVTMLMGVVPTIGAYQEIIRLLTTDDFLMEPIEYRLGAPYLASKRSGFIFADVEPQGLLRARRRRAAELLEGLMRFDRHGGPDNVSHATVGYTEGFPENLGSLSDILAGVASAESYWRIALVGSRGTAVEILHEFPL